MRAVAAGDFDGDGDADVAATDSISSQLIWLLGDGVGNLTPGGALAGGSGVLDVRAADLNGDGTADVAWTAASDGQLRTALGGPGGLAAHSATAVQGGAGHVAFGDFNEDGNLDALVGSLQAAANATWNLLLADGSGGFASQSPHAFGFALAGRRIAAADVSGDGHVDAVWVDGSTKLRWAEGNGFGAFPVQNAELQIDAPAPAIALATGDLNGDGIDDVVSIYSAVTGEGTISIAASNGAGGLSVTALPDLYLPPLAAGLVRDLTGDGSLDVAIAGESTWLFEGSGAGSVALRARFASRCASDNFDAGRLDSADFNGDGQNDLVLHDANTGEVALLLRSSHAPPADFGAPQLGTAPGTEVPFGGFALLQDVDGDGDTDLVAPAYGSAAVLTNDGYGGFLAGPSFPLGFLDTPLNAIDADLDGDGRRDLVVSTANELRHLLATGSGYSASLQDALFAPGLGRILAVAAGDLDSDADADLAVLYTPNAAQFPNPSSVVLLQNDGTAHFAQVGSLPSGYTLNARDALLIADVTADGNADLVLGNIAPNVVPWTSPLPGRATLWRRTGAFAFAAAVHYPTGTDPGSPVAADFDVDGRLDLAFANASNPVASDGSSAFAVSILRGTAAGFAPVQQLVPATLAAAITAADLDGDGRLDLAGSASGLGRGVFTLLNLGAGAFLPAEWFAGAAGALTLRAADFDLDSDVDLVTGALVVLEQRDDPAPPCTGSAATYGIGCPGAGGFVPHLAAAGCASPGAVLQISVTGAPPAGMALLFAGTAAGALPIGFGCLLHVAPPFAALAVPLFGNAAGLGSVTLTTALPALTAPISVTLQAFASDPLVPAHFASSNGLLLTIQ